ncbi:hypothetical protein J6E39_00940 [bacterium]|nr:hypothetical protein [bacterium]
MGISDFLSQLGADNKSTVYMSVTPGVGLEMILFDTNLKQVKNYTYRPLEYNESLREISNYEAFKQATLEMLDELNLSHKSNIVLNLPLVHFGSKDIQLMVDDEGVSTIVTSEVEQSYIFKRYDPLISWVESDVATTNDSRKVFYTAIQQNTIDNIEAALSEIGANLVSVDISLSSILRTLSYANLAPDQMKDGVSWNLMIINQNGYSICSMVGKKVIDYSEEALAVKSFEGDEIYKAINASAQLTLMSYPANYLYIISETDDVSAEILANTLQVDGNITVLENNRYKKQEVIPVSLDVLQGNVLKISLEAVGIAISKTASSPLKFNILGGKSDSGNDEGPAKIKLGEKEYEITPQEAIRIALVVDIPLAILALILFLTIPAYSKNLNAKLDGINSELQTVQSQISEIQNKNGNGQFNLKDEIKKVLDTNRTKLMSYAAIGESVPRNLWVTYYNTKDDGKIDIKGEATNVKDVYTFFRGMKDSLLNVQLRLHKLEMDSGSLDDIVNPNKQECYKFEITNMTDAELAPPATENAENAGAQPGAAQPAAEGQAAAPAPPADNPAAPSDEPPKGLSPLGANFINFKK